MLKVTKRRPLSAEEQALPGGCAPEGVSSLPLPAALARGGGLISELHPFADSPGGLKTRAHANASVAGLALQGAGLGQGPRVGPPPGSQGAA